MSAAGRQLRFDRETVVATIVEPGGRLVERQVEIRTHPITGRTCRITFSRKGEREAGTETLPPPPPAAVDTAGCPFCEANYRDMTPRLPPALEPDGRLVLGRSVLFPNLFPYGSYSAVSLFDPNHFVEIGTASPESYRDSLINCQRYLKRVLAADPAAIYTAVTQNHLPSAGGSLVHPHLQVHADRVAANHHRTLYRAAEDYAADTGRMLMSDVLDAERRAGERIIGASGNWQWLAAFAPEGFFEVWGILPGVVSLPGMSAVDCSDLARGICNAQRFFRSLNRNGYNLGLMSVACTDSPLELRAVLTVRSNYAAWVRNDHTGFEVMLGDMATFAPPEETARLARPFWT